MRTFLVLQKWPKIAKVEPHDREHGRCKDLINNVRNGRSPQSLGNYGRDGTKRYKDYQSPPWLVFIIAQIAEENGMKVVQSEGDKDIAIMMLAKEKNCPIMSADSDFLIFANKPVIK